MAPAQRPPCMVFDKYGIALWWSVIGSWILLGVLCGSWGYTGEVAGVAIHNFYPYFSLLAVITAILIVWGVIVFEMCLLLVAFWLRVLSIIVITAGYIVNIALYKMYWERKYKYYTKAMLEAYDVGNGIQTYAVVALIFYVLLEASVIYCVYLLCSYGRGVVGCEAVKPQNEGA